MVDGGNGSPGLGEISRRVQDIFSRFEALLNKLDQVYLTKEAFTLWQNLIVERFRTASQQQDLTDKTLGKHEAKIDQLDQRVDPTELDKRYMTKDGYQEAHQNLIDRVADLESDRQWLIRLIIGLVIAGLVGGAFVFSKATG